jgi:hypothetical protein
MHFSSHFGNRDDLSRQIFGEIPDFANPHHCGDAFFGDALDEQQFQEPLGKKVREKIHVTPTTNVTKRL